MKRKKLSIKDNCLIVISISCLIFSIGLKLETISGINNVFLEYEYINIKDIARTNITMKRKKSNVWTSLLSSIKDSTNLTLVEENITPVQLTLEETPFLEQNIISNNYERLIWRLPTEIGRITQNPHYNHAAIDITSPRGSSEYIFPIANGVISSIYTDYAGALIVTVLHRFDGYNVTSLYAHLSSYAEGIYVGKEVTVNDVLGKMGTTGNSTGVHLHLAVADCALFDPSDANCATLDGFFNYASRKVQEGYWGLGNYIIVPESWNSR